MCNAATLPALEMPGRLDALSQLSLDSGFYGSGVFFTGGKKEEGWTINGIWDMSESGTFSGASNRLKTR